MNVSLSDTFEQFINAQISTGKYNNASEVVREALRLQMQKEEAYQAKLNALRNDLDEACKQIDNGEVSNWDVNDFLSSMDESSKS